jgi:HD-like signal output (HDOD) protein
LLTAFRRILWAHHLLPDRGLRASLGRFSVFPQSPATARLVSDHQSGLSPSIDMLACACLADVTLLARTLRIARFDTFDASAPLDSVMNALHALGNEPVARISESVECGSSLDSTTSHSWFRWADETRHAFDVANRMQRILEQAAPSLAQSGALVGLLHDLGRLALLAVYPSTMRSLHEHATKGMHEEVHRERELFGTDHCQVGAYVLALWGYPEEVVVPVLAHHSGISQCIADEESLPYAPILAALRLAEKDANLHGAAPAHAIIEGSIASTFTESAMESADHAANDSGLLPMVDLSETEYG